MDEILYRRIQMAKMRAKEAAALRGESPGAIHMAGVFAAEQAVIDSLDQKMKKKGKCRIITFPGRNKNDG